mmetsp:Transcript_62680/g.183791  ORF Transcript_62680/g.183791 Transcript_62680/m.183791 type:complete len:499 (-) Transcript_62680:115-1611(-)
MIRSTRSCTRSLRDSRCMSARGSSCLKKRARRAESMSFCTEGLLPMNMLLPGWGLAAGAPSVSSSGLMRPAMIATTSLRAVTQNAPICSERLSKAVMHSWKCRGGLFVPQSFEERRKRQKSGRSSSGSPFMPGLGDMISRCSEDDLDCADGRLMLPEAPRLSVLSSSAFVPGGSGTKFAKLSTARRSVSSSWLSNESVASRPAASSVLMLARFGAPAAFLFCSRMVDCIWMCTSEFGIVCMALVCGRATWRRAPAGKKLDASSPPWHDEKKSCAAWDRAGEHTWREGPSYQYVFACSRSFCRTASRYARLCDSVHFCLWVPRSCLLDRRWPPVVLPVWSVLSVRAVSGAPKAGQLAPSVARRASNGPFGPLPFAGLAPGPSLKAHCAGIGAVACCSLTMSAALRTGADRLTPRGGSFCALAAGDPSLPHARGPSASHASAKPPHPRAARFDEGKIPTSGTCPRRDDCAMPGCASCARRPGDGKPPPPSVRAILGLPCV